MSSAVAAAGSGSGAAATAATAAAAVLALSAAWCLRKQGEALVLLVAAAVAVTAALPGAEVKRGLPSASRVSRKARPVTFLPTLPLPCLFLQRTWGSSTECSEAAGNIHVL
jgi:hypothetical protein